AGLTPEEMVAGLIELAPTLSPEARSSVASQLQAVGLSGKESANAFLGLPPGQPLHLERAVKLLVITAELMLALDHLSWALWKQLSPKSTIRKEAELNRLAGSY